MRSLLTSTEYRLLVQHSPVMTWRAGIDASCDYFNETWLSFTGRELAQEIGNGWAEGVHPDDLPGCLSHYLEHFDRREAFEMEYRLRRHDGVYRWIFDRGVPFTDDEGLFAGFIGSCVDVDDRRKTQEAQDRHAQEQLAMAHDFERKLQGVNQLLEQRVEAAIEHLRSYQRMVEQVSDYALISLTLDGRVATWNQGAERIKGYSATEALGLDFRRFYSGEDQRNGRPDRLLRIALDEGVARDEGWRVRQDGSRFWASVTVTALHDESGKPIGFSKVTRDLSEQLERARLRQEKESAVAAERAKSAFLATMSHEIRTPMNAIIGMSGLLADTELSGEQRDYVRTIGASGEHLLAVINNILDYSKLESGHFELDRSAFKVATVVEEALELIGVNPRAKPLKLGYELGRGVPAVLLGDVGRIRQVLLNYLSNAVKFTDRGEVHISVDAVPTEPRSFMLEFRVRDTGIGIPAEKRSLLFQSFSQVDESARRRFDGTGLGLVICKQLSQLMGGNAWIENHEGPGSTFGFSVRAQLASEAAVTAPAATQLGSAVPSDLADRNPLRILVAEDNAANVKVISILLSRMGYRADLASNGREAVAAVLRQRYDLILMDVQMPEMDGVEATRQICEEIPELQRPQIVALTAGVLADERQRCLDAGMSAVLNKPVQVNELVAVLSRCRPLRVETET